MRVPTIIRPIAFAVAAALGVAAASTAATSRELMIYSASDGVSAPLVEAFKKIHPGRPVRHRQGEESDGQHQPHFVLADLGEKKPSRSECIGENGVRNATSATMKKNNISLGM